MGNIIGTGIVIGIVIGIIGLTVYGLVLAFTTSVIVGVLHLVITPLSFITGFAMFFFDVDISNGLATFISNL